ncbi:hypothetical protein PsorP6_013721 [Peronosclerospora sorghi]|uniref:Uncharacterized protein n=1 Tax=Peronosclerospora sorghi TaxID=230839 RepID=A0ACC0VIM1_9STRA|nr:hypothetical protein PsorP6_013721 [Peronosclerospora sorghi]
MLCVFALLYLPDILTNIVQVANEQRLKLPAELYSEECRLFVDQCLTIDPDKRPSADMLLQHPFLHKYTAEETLAEWTAFIGQVHLCEERVSDLESLGDAVYRHMYEHSVKFSHMPQSCYLKHMRYFPRVQSDNGVSFVSQATPMFSRRQICLQPVQMSTRNKSPTVLAIANSLQLGLANYLDLPVHLVHEKFEEVGEISLKDQYISWLTQPHMFIAETDKLLENYCYSPQSWTASPGISRRQQFGIGTDSPQCTPREKGSFWRKLQKSMAKIGSSKRRKERERRRSTAAL